MTRFICALFSIIFFGLSINAQTSLSPGDIVIISIGGDSKSFRFVPLVNLSQGTEIYFTDSGWIGPGFRANEGAVKYTAPALIQAGTNIEYVAGAANFTTVSDANVGTNGFLLSTGGDQVLAFQGSTSAPNFIYAVQSNSTQWQASATNSNTSGLPSGLTNGVNAIAYGSGPGAGDEFDNIWYDCSITDGTPAAVLSAVSNQNNWIGDNVNYTPCTTNFFNGGGNGGNPTTLFIHDIQGSGSTVTNSGTTVIIEGIVIGDYQLSSELSGFFIQEETADEDGDPLTSEGIFVFCNTCPVDVMEGDLVQVEGVAGEFFDMSQIDASAGTVTKVSSGNIGLVTPAVVNLPVATGTDQLNTFEAIEGMMVSFANPLTVTEHFQLARFGQLTLSVNGKQRQFTQDNTPTAAGFALHQTDIARHRIILDDYNNLENIDPVIHPEPGNFSVNNTVRGGATVGNLVGVMHWSFAGIAGTNAWRVRPMKTNPVSFSDSNPRPPNPANNDDLRIVSFNVLNYFNGNGSGGGFPTARGAHSVAEFNRQSDKIVQALIALDADIVGLIELENDYNTGANSAIASLVNDLNATLGSVTYQYVNPGGNIGSDQIANGFIYKTNTVGLIGNHQILATPAFLDPNNTGSDRNRPALAQTFQIVDANNPGFAERLTVVVNHFKSKGSSCGAGDDDTTMGQGNCNATRTGASNALINWLNTDPTGSGDPDFVVVGDLNAYAMEDPIVAFTNAGYVDHVNAGITDASSFVFSGEWGTLDYILTSASLSTNVATVDIWNINADESSLLDYNDTILDPGESAFEAKPSTNPLYNGDEFRSSDHDPTYIGFDFGGNCPFLLPVNNIVSSALYEASHTVISDGLIPSPNVVEYSAGNQVVLEAGFEVQQGAEFHGYILGCN